MVPGSKCLSLNFCRDLVYYTDYPAPETSYPARKLSNLPEYIFPDIENKVFLHIFPTLIVN